MYLCSLILRKGITAFLSPLVCSSSGPWYRWTCSWAAIEGKPGFLTLFKASAPAALSSFLLVSTASPPPPPPPHPLSLSENSSAGAPAKLCLSSSFFCTDCIGGAVLPPEAHCAQRPQGEFTLRPHWFWIQSPAAEKLSQERLRQRWT